MKWYLIKQPTDNNGLFKIKARWRLTNIWDLFSICYEIEKLIKIDFSSPSTSIKIYLDSTLEEMA